MENTAIQCRCFEPGKTLDSPHEINGLLQEAYSY